MYTKETFLEDLRRMGLSPRDTLFVHSSYKAIAGGEGVEGGGDTIIDALIEYFADEGLLVFPAMSWKLGWLVNDRGDYIPPYEGPREGFYPYGTDFHVRSTPSSDIGILPELFRVRPGVVRSLCPTSSIAAIGSRAREFCAGHETARGPLSWDSPWGNLYRYGAKILFAGTTMRCNTFMHVIEDSADLPGLQHPYVWHYTVEDYDGSVREVSYHRHEPGHNHYYKKVQPELLEQGIARTVRFGAAECQLVDARSEAEYMWKKLKEDPYLFYHEPNGFTPVD